MRAQDCVPAVSYAANHIEPDVMPTKLLSTHPEEEFDVTVLHSPGMYERVCACTCTGKSRYLKF